MVNRRTNQEVSEERELVLRYRLSLDAGAEDIEARNKLVEMHEPLIRWMAKSIHLANQQSTDLSEMVNVATVGMISGLRKFDPSRGNRVSTYCVWYIRDALHQYVRQTRWSSYLPEIDYKALTKLHRAMAKIHKGYNGHIDVKELAVVAKMEESAVHRLLALTKSVLSIETPISRNGKLKLGDRLEQPTNHRSVQFWQAYEFASSVLTKSIETLPEEEKEAVLCHFYERSPYIRGADGRVVVLTQAMRDKGLRKLRKIPAVKQAYEALNSIDEN